MDESIILYCSLQTYIIHILALECSLSIPYSASVLLQWGRPLWSDTNYNFTSIHPSIPLFWAWRVKRKIVIWDFQSICNADLAVWTAHKRSCLAYQLGGSLNKKVYTVHTAVWHRLQLLSLRVSVWDELTMTVHAAPNTTTNEKLTLKLGQASDRVTAGVHSVQHLAVVASIKVWASLKLSTKWKGHDNRILSYCWLLTQSLKDISPCGWGTAF